MGVSVQHLHQIGGGCPDLVIGHRGINVLVEIKDGDKPPSKRKLTGDEVLWHDQWKGWKAIVETVDDCIKLVSQINKLQIPDDWTEDV